MKGGRRAALAAPAAVVLVLTTFAAARPLGPVPTLGPLLEPAHGVWSLSRTAELPRRAGGRVPGLGAPVDVRYDHRGVPHIFARTEDDAYRALGYVVARDRLFQLDIQTRAAAGTLTEIAGPRALELDREMRELGLGWGAERRWAALDSTASTHRAIRAYADGVNAWIDAMRPEEVPIEYRLLGARPARWRAINSVYLLQRMAWTLTAYSDVEFRRLRARARVGRRAAEALFPVNAPIVEPIVPNGRRAPRFDVAPLPPPDSPDTAAARLAALIARAAGWSLAHRARHSPDADAVGSNNWAVSPRRTKNGFALLAGDPHLELTLPSIWYEAHLVVPGRLDVYGVTIPGAPAIVIGFNRDVAWTFTNTESDVIDRFVETVDDTARPRRYTVDGESRPLARRVETYRGRRGEVLRVDTVRYTHRGPLAHAEGRWLSVRWTAHDTSGDPVPFLDASRARSAEGWMSAMAAFPVPAQNMLVADRGGNIAIRSTGHFPVRGAAGRGDTLLDGTRSADDWRGYLPPESYPQAMNPSQGYLASANQQPVDPRADSTYFGADWYPPWRAMRINALLRGDSVVTADAMRRYQSDRGSPRADLLAPALVAAARRVLSRSEDAELREGASILAAWDRRYDGDSRGAVLFEATTRELYERTWDELDSSAAPSAMAMLSLLADSASPWWDDRRTPGAIETRDGIVASSLVAALRRVRRERGDVAGAGWRWDHVQHANIYHLLHVPGLSALGLPAPGGPSTLSPSSGNGTEGSSWRMVVELGPEVHAWTTYPGGQSGNPASSRYTDRLPRWLAGELDPAFFPRRADEVSGARLAGSLELAPRP